VDARKTSIGRDDALKLLKDVDELYACKGKRVTTIDLRTQKPTADELAALIIGPTGNLRAPALRVGRKLIVGFEPETYKKIFD
jgi:arsenate reductase-like glutaredoxin family protein